MTNEELKTRILELAPDAVVSDGKQYLEAVIPAATLHVVAKALRDDGDTAFDYLFCLSGTDFPEYMMVYYHLESYRHKHVVVLNTKTDSRDDPFLDTVADLWPTAEFHEREVYDLLGIRFNGHPDLRRLILDEGWKYPLRKDYIDESKIVER
jgi:NADH-quinone oxidoreductase subunit C